MINFKCHISSLVAKVQINIKDNNTPQLIEREISRIFNLKQGQFLIENIPPQKKIKKIKHSHEITIKILKPSNDLIFVFPNNPLTIKNCFNKDFNSIINQFKIQNIFFSQDFYSKLKFFIWKIEIPRNNFYFDCIPEGTSLIVEPKKAVFMKYSFCSFYFTENETIFDAENEIKKYFFGSYVFISNFLNKAEKLNCKSVYNVQVHIYLSICQANSPNCFIKDVDFFTTIFEMKQILSIDLHLAPERIHFYSPNGNCSDNFYLTNIMYFDKQNNKNVIYFDIINIQPINYPILNPVDQLNPQIPNTNNNNKQTQNNSLPEKNSIVRNKYLKITFIFESNTDIQFSEDVDFDITFEDLAKMIKESQKINDQIVFKYDDFENNRVTINSELKISDIFDDMQTEGDKIEEQTHLFIGIIKKKKNIPLSKIKPKIAENEDDDNKAEKDKSKKDNKKESENDGKNEMDNENKQEEDDNNKKKKGNGKKKNRTEADNDNKNKKETEDSNEMKNKTKKGNNNKKTKTDDDNKNKQKNDDNKTKKENKKKKTEKGDENENKQETNDDNETKDKTKKGNKKKKTEKGDNENKQKAEDNKEEMTDKTKKRKENDKDDDKESVQNESENKEEEKNDLEIIEEEEEVESENEKEESEKEDSKTSKKKNSSKNQKKYLYQTSNDSEVKEMKLDVKAKVIDMKKSIADLNDVENLANIKILFAGKDLLNDIVLDSLNIGDTILFVYIRSEEDILLMTAKALQITNNENDDDNDE